MERIPATDPQSASKQGMTAPEMGSSYGTRVHRNANPGGLLFRWLVASPLWREAIHEMSRHFPPSGAELTVLDVNSGDTATPQLFLEHRAELRIIALDTSAKVHSQPVSTDQL